MFLKHGFAETTMRLVAVEAGASTETVYRHFGSKDEMFIEVVGNRTQELRQRIETDLESTGPLPTVLESVGMSLFGAMVMPEVSALGCIIVGEVPAIPRSARRSTRWRLAGRSPS